MLTFECSPTSLADVEPDKQCGKNASSAVDVPNLEAETGAADGVVQVWQSECDSPCYDFGKGIAYQCRLYAEARLGHLLQKAAVPMPIILERLGPTHISVATDHASGPHDTLKAKTYTHYKKKSQRQSN